MKKLLPPPVARNLAKAILLLLALTLIGLQAADFRTEYEPPQLNDRLHAPPRTNASELSLIASASSGPHGRATASELGADPGGSVGRHPFNSLGRLEPILE